MRSRTTEDCAWLVLAVAVTRYLFRTESPYLLDSINFILGVTEFDPARHQPHPPGYYLYIQAARLLQFVWSDPHTALVALSIIASCGAVVLVYLLTLEWFGPRAARFAGLMFLASPLGWFHGGVALVYIVEMFFSLLVGLLCWRNSETRGSAAFSSAVALGLAAGVRQSSIAFLAPLWLFSLRRAGAFRILAACGLLAATLLAWILPMASASGGFTQYWGALENIWTYAAGRELADGEPIGTTLPMIGFRALCIMAVYALVFGAALPLPLMRRLPAGFDPSKRLFSALWIAPGLLFFALIFMRLINAGYLLLLMPPVFSVLGAQAAEWFEEAGHAPLGRRVAVAGFALVNLAIFLFNPTTFSYSRIRADARETLEFVDTIRKAVSPRDTMLVAIDNHLHGARHAGYYLPEFLTVEWPESDSASGNTVWAMHGGQAELLQKIPTGEFRKFVYFPPGPNGPKSVIAEYGNMHFPPEMLRVERVDGSELFSGPSSELWRLFPKASPQPR